MILHRPSGSGHAYRLDADQRVPVIPVAGELLELRATTAADSSLVEVELERGGRRVTLRADLVSPDDDGAPVAGGHLAAAASASPTRGRVGWCLRLDRLRPAESLRYRFSDDRGNRTRWHETSVAAWEATGGELRLNGAAEGRPCVEIDSVRWLVSPDGAHRCRLALPLEERDRVVGFGERFNALDQRGRTLDSVVFEQYKRQGARTYMPMPFAIVVGDRSWGFHVATSRRVWFDVGASDPERLWVEVDVAPDDPTIELRLFNGEPAAVLGAFVEETGAPVLPPEWVFGHWMSANEWNTQARVLAEVERSEREGIPVSVLVIEAWSDEATFVAFRDSRAPVHDDGAPHHLSDFDFPADGAWPDPKGLVDSLHERGIRVLLWQIPLLKLGARDNRQLRADRRTLIERGYGVRDADGRPYRNRGWWFPRALLPDFTSPEARRWWLDKRRYLVDEVGIDGFKTDGGEHAWGDELRYADGTRGAETNNLYPMLYSEAFHQLMQESGRPPLTFSRAGFTGSARYPAHWAGDESSTWEAFRASLTAGLSAGASGILFWGWDIGGFSGEIPSAELYLRSAAAACLTPIMQYHSEFNHHRQPCGDRTPWNIAERTGDPRALTHYRDFVRLRMRLQKYLVAQARRAVERRLPLMRALCFEWPHDSRVWDFPYQWLLGEDVLVAAVVEEGAESWRVYLPAGEWIDAWTGTPAAPGEHEVDAPLDRIPVYLRSRADHLIEQFAG